MFETVYKNKDEKRLWQAYDKQPRERSSLGKYFRYNK